MKKKTPARAAHGPLIGQRRAELRTWQPDGQVAHTVKVRWLRLRGSVAALVDAAGQMYPDWQPLQVNISFSDQRRPSMVISFGISEGVERYISIELKAVDVPAIVAHLFRSAVRCTGLVVGICQTNGGDDELTVPTISPAAFASMEPTVVTIQ